MPTLRQGPSLAGAVECSHTAPAAYFHHWMINLVEIQFLALTEGLPLTERQKLGMSSREKTKEIIHQPFAGDGC